MMGKRNLIFDVDGTIWDTTPLVAEAWNEGLRIEMGYEACITTKILKKEFGKTMEVIAQDLFGAFLPEDQARAMQICVEYEERFLEKNTKDLTYPGVRETFAALAARGDKLFIVSNCQLGYIELCMEKVGLTTYVTDHLCYGDTLRGKAANIRELMRRNGLSEAFYIGDTMGDYEASVEAGVPFIHARYGFGVVPEAKRSIGEIRELLDEVE